ncbi:RuvC family protein [Haematospirillum jordaniae]|uniref:Uncharacterized protein n=1 Tax=Haematospirillum jordaniae TaxID=1549855 RepID=A0A143DDT6_9PROT|nr:hypothetical protein [Haematospirillum jordaniae]AMW34865.1 hypothetical protein AY555_06390 [Haematospirillum jordaniae]NKD66679.1 hypothetical protein [Haematospirillum jordaniae]NKD81157.1 hypothetical protein [Haematospirillum jordaniae]NKD85176.1 hypothetical protein [Haematospirillum jordaniae]NKD89475.1 hypothetical protein [Haematospirillum jordaniae]
MRILGVDPGAYGALALLVDGRLTDVVDMPVLKVRRGRSDKAEVDGYSLAVLLRSLAPDLALVEQVGGMPGQSPGASFNFGRAVGAVEYSLKTLGVRVETVAPATWKRAMRLKGGKDDSRALAMRMWPTKAALFQRVKDDGRAEAALIAAWARAVPGSPQEPGAGCLQGEMPDVFA